MKLIMPYFVVHGRGIKKPIKSMPGNFHFSVDMLVKEVKSLKKIGIKSILLFGIPQKKDLAASEAYSYNGIIQQALRALKEAKTKVQLITDVCLCEYVTHGHCGVLKGRKIDRKKTLELYAKTAVSHAEAGADMVAPSGMQKKQVLAIRSALNKAGQRRVKIMGYSAKYASAFYGPFREAAGSAPSFGDRTAYQMDPASNYREALKEVAADVSEGADIVMVKPALAYLDIIREVKRKFKKPLAAYNVSGEFSMVKAAAQKGYIDEKRVMFEIVTAIKRAGADILISYHAKEIANASK